MNLEAGSDRLLKFIGKKHTCEQAREVFYKIHESNPTVKISTNIMLGLPTEDMGDILETAKLILDTRPNYIHCNYFICSPKLPLAKYPQITESCREYHLKKLIIFLKKLPIEKNYEFSMDCYWIYKKPLSRANVREMEILKADNKEFKKQGLLPEHYLMEFTIKRKG